MPLLERYTHAWQKIVMFKINKTAISPQPLNEILQNKD